MSDEQPPVQPPPTRGSRVVDPDATTDDHTYALLMHLSVFTGVAIIIPVLMWQLKKNASPFIEDHGKEATNFQISVLIYSLIATLAAFATCGVGIVLIFPVMVLMVVGAVLAAIAAGRGEYYRYPMTIRLIH